MERKRVTQKDIAAETGVTQTTVSLALRGHHSIPAATRKRILAAAQRLRYRPDPMLASLVAYRSNLKRPVFQGTLAWLTNHSTEDGWKSGRTKTQPRAYFRGAKIRAQELGFNLETFWLNAPGITADRMRDIFTARNIAGILLPPQSKAHTAIDFLWDDSASVTFGYSLVSPSLHTVMNHQFRNMLFLIRKLRELGHKRIGLAMPSSQDERVDHNYLGGYLAESSTAVERSCRVPYEIRKSFNQETFNRWFEKYRPEVVVTDLATAQQVYNWLGEMDYRVPHDVGIALPNLPDGERLFSGIDENPELIGSTAIEMVVGMIHRNEHGIPDQAHHHLITGRWSQGKSVLIP